MWPFSQRSARSGQPAPTPTEMTKWADFESNSASLKVWLPQLLVERVNWVSKETGASRPDIIRGLVFEHLYGRVAMQMLAAYKADKDREAERRQREAAKRDPERIDMLWSEEVKFSRGRRSDIDVAFFGKSDSDLTVDLPLRMKRDIEDLAKWYRLTPSTYVRKALVLELLGEQVHKRWQEALGNISADVLKLEQE